MLFALFILYVCNNAYACTSVCARILFVEVHVYAHLCTVCITSIHLYMYAVIWPVCSVGETDCTLSGKMYTVTTQKSSLH